MSQKTRATGSSCPCQGRSWNVLASGRASTSASWTRLKPSMADPSKVMPSSSAFSSSAGVMLNAFGVPEDVGEPQLDEADAPLLDRAQHVVPLVSAPAHSPRSPPPASGRGHRPGEPGRRVAAAMFTLRSHAGNSRGNRRVVRLWRQGPCGSSRAGLPRNRAPGDGRVQSGGKVIKRTPAEVRPPGQGRGDRDRRRAIRRPARDDPALLGPGPRADRGGLHRGLRLRRLVDPGLPADPRVGHDPAARPEHGRTSTRSASTRRSTSTASSTTRSPSSPTRATRATSPARPRRTCSRPASPTPPTSGPRPSSSSSTTSSTARA